MEPETTSNKVSEIVEEQEDEIEDVKLVNEVNLTIKSSLKFQLMTCLNRRCLCSSNLWPCISVLMNRQNSYIGLSRSMNEDNFISSSRQCFLHFRNLRNSRTSFMKPRRMMRNQNDMIWRLVDLRVFPLM